MAVAACTFVRDFGSAELSNRYTDESISARYIITLDAASDDWPTILEQAQAISGGGNTAPPLRGESWPTNPGYGLYAKRFTMRLENAENSLLRVLLDVSYLPLDAGEPDPGTSPDNPLFWPAEYDIQYAEEEFVVEQAKNVEAFTGAGGYGRPAGTLGPVTNSAGDETEEPLVDVERVAVVKIVKNVPNLDTIVSVNTNYARTTNSDNFLGAGPRRAKFIGAESGGKQNANGIIYYPMTVSVAIHKTTDRVVNNVGWNNLDFDGKKVKYTVNNDDPSSPQFLTLSGGRTTAVTKVTYRYLDEVSYAGLL